MTNFLMNHGITAALVVFLSAFALASADLITALVMLLGVAALIIAKMGELH